MEGLLERFRAQTEMLKKAIVLRDASLQKGTHVDALGELAGELARLENAVADIKAYVEGEEAQLTEAEAVLEALSVQRSRVDHVQANIPDKLPRFSGASQDNRPDPKIKLGLKKKKTSKTQLQIKRIAYVRVDEFDGTPKYIRGRVNRDQVNQVVDTIYNAMVAKHKILGQPRAKLSDVDLNRFTGYKEAQSKETEGLAFIVESDIKDLTSTKVDSTMRTSFAILRHLARIKEIRGGGLTRYVML